MGNLVVWLDRSFWIHCRCSGRQLLVVRKPVMHEVPRRSMTTVRSCSISDPSSRRQAPVESESLPEICTPMPDANGGVLSEECDDVQESRGAGTRPARWQRGGRRNQRRKRAIACAQEHEWFLDDHHRLRMQVDQMTVALGAKSCMDSRGETELSDRSLVVPHVCAEAHASSGRRRRHRRCPRRVSPWFEDPC